MRYSTPILATLALAAAAALGACGIHGRSTQRLQVTAPPPALLENAFEAAGAYSLPGQEALEIDGLSNVVFLGKNIISGDEPEDSESFARLRRWGVRTIVTVDGKIPNATEAGEHGMRYVHIPITYSGITDRQLDNLAKTFRELEGPFYVHCYHGKHRGPAAAAIGRLVLDGIPREQAIAEMRQYCKTSPKYSGLYQDVASAEMPTVAATEQSTFDFAQAHRFEGLRATMVQMARLKDRLEWALDRDWAPDPEHPDVDALQDATQLHALLVASTGMSGERPSAYSAWMDASTAASTDLVRALSDCHKVDSDTDRNAAGTDPQWMQDAERAFLAMDASCSACHVDYRN